MFDWDVFVIGGGPAGLACAIAARRKGFRVALADGQKPPIDKACGEGLMSEAVQAASDIGIALPPGFPLRGIRFHSGGASIQAGFPPGKWLAIRRTVLHQALADEAESSGVELRWETPVSGIERNSIRMAGGSASARWIIGTDGAGSRVRKWADLDHGSVGRRFGVRRHYAVEPWTDFVEVHWGSDFQIYVTPMACSEVCIALISRDPHRRIDPSLECFPELKSRLAGAPILTSDRGGASFSRRLNKIYRGPVALLGDASGSVDAITGEGICLAFQQAQALARALVSGGLSSYHAVHERLMRRPRLMSGILLTLDRHPALRTRVFEAMSANPDLFARMLAAHVGAAPLRDLAGTGLALGFQISARSLSLRRAL
ncbi:MAG TPA: NAD(P)/FAD-dependent oxidoreductase [Bryobacteraceae bacterium]|nr:NAD(P)/FAD-dependent oxidoreductase [Bryobacteraceae bacterium]